MSGSVEDRMCEARLRSVERVLTKSKDAHVRRCFVGGGKGVKKR